MLLLIYFDPVSGRGKRHAVVALENNDAKNLLKGFDFNGDCSLDELVKKQIVVTGGEMHIADINVQRQLKWPKGADGMELKGCITDINLANGRFIRYNTNTVEVLREEVSANIHLSAGVLPGAVGTRVYVVRCCFFSERNGVKYYFKGKKGCAMRVVGVG